MKVNQTKWWQVCAVSLCVLVNASTACALAQAWKIMPDNSKIVFAAVQNGAQVQGKFSKFSGTIHFDPADLSGSKVNIIVDMNSLSTSYDDLTTALKAPDWFDIKVFPEAIFNASKMTKTGDNQYQAEGTLAIRDKSVPVTLAFTMQPNGDSAVVNGSTTLKRTAFGVGQGEWSSVHEVQDDVKVNFTVNAVKTQQEPPAS